ncbi:hypothetical protein DH2020_008937 [Rehmannia glutinosa]|uniref:Anaphase-promoting complex subunit 4 n=1 Tax=Rehmannia glutinosa TaxID=99300 RepID=A0ABR0X5H7_REHGL
MEDDDESQRVVPFQLQFDKPVASQIKLAEWNPEKDLLAMVTEDSKLLLHRFNWQRLWTASPGKCITSICWRPDGKAIAVGLDDGTISLHDVEAGTHNNSTYEDRTARFFPPAPRVPRTPGLVPGDNSSFMEETDDSFRELLDSSHQQFDILCSGDKDGNICFNIFGIFHIGNVNIHNLVLQSSLVGNHVSRQLMDASIFKVALSSDLCHIIVLCSGVLTDAGPEGSNNQMSGSDLQGLHSLVLDSTIFQKRKNELHQVAQQASNVEHLIEIIRRSLSVMSKQWSDAMHVYHEKFNALSTLIGLKRAAKVVCGAGKELQTIVLDHLQPAAEIIAFRMGELRGLSKWRARFLGIGLDENLIDNATEKAGMLLVQIERFNRILSSVVQQETKQRVRELTHFGGFSDCEYLRRTLAEEFLQLQSCFKEALEMPLTTVSRRILCKDMLPLFPVSSLPNFKSSYFPVSVSYYQDASHSAINHVTTSQRLTDYTSFMVPDETYPNFTNCIGIAKGLMHDQDNLKSGHHSLEIAVLHVPDGYHCVDLSLYKDSVIHLHLENEKVREISHSVVAPLAVSASRGVACVFAARKRALVYILEEDEDEITDSE